MSTHDLTTAIAVIPPGGWAVGVSGGADSMALLLMMGGRHDITPHVVHLDHQTRAAESTGDAEFVADLAGRLGVKCTIARRKEMEPEVPSLPANPSARYRALRMALFRRVIEEHRLQGVVLAHHADDVAETVLHRLLRGSGATGLAGMTARSEVGGMTILRPLLGVRRQRLREFLHERGQAWREDSSNASDAYLRNRLRRLLATLPELTDSLLHLGQTCAGLRDWVRTAAPELPPEFAVGALVLLPPILARESARRWLIAREVPAGELTPRVVDRLLNMATDAASAPRQHFPGGVLVRRRGGKLLV